jgi:uncharacterized membrane protein
MLSLVFSLLMSIAGGNGSSVEHLMGQRIAAKVFGGVADKVIALKISDDDADDNSDSPDDEDTEALPQTGVVAPTPPVPPIPPVPPKAPRFEFDSGRRLPKFTEKAKAVPTVELLHRIAQTAGWSMTVVGSPKDAVDIDVKDVDPREALRQVLKQSGAMGVLKNDKLVVVAIGDTHTAGMLIERSGSRKSVIVQAPDLSGQPQPQQHRSHNRHGGNDLVHVFQGDLTVTQGRVVQGDVVCVGGSVELEPGTVVQGDVVAVGGSVTVDEGALVMGQAVAVLGTVDVARGAQVMGEHTQVGVGKLFGGKPRRHRGLTSLGPFGLFPTVALFALIYLVGLLVLRLWPERVRNVGFALFENPVRSFTVGFLCWLLLLPLVVLLAISVVGILLIPLLPVIFFLSIVIGLSSFAMRIGEALPAGPGQRFVPPAALGMGMAVLMLVAFVPWLGVSLLALLQFFALGASIGSRFGRALPPHVA